MTFCFVAGSSLAQKTLKLESDGTSPPATIGSVSWIAGHWQGEAWGGQAEEIWSEPQGGAMMGSFRHVVDNKVNLYEFMTISEEDGTLVLKIKHFNSDLTGWESKDESVEFRLVKLGDEVVYFDGFTFELKDKNHLSLYVMIEGKEEAFDYHRVK